MRFRLIHSLSVLLLSAVSVAVLAMAMVMAWSLSSGFNDYLQARDTERLEQFAALFSEMAVQAGGLEALRQRTPNLREVLAEFGQRQGLPGRRTPLVDAPRSGNPPDAMQRQPPPGGSDGFGPRVTVVSLEGKPLFSRPSPTLSGPFLERPIRLDGEIVAMARLRQIVQASDAVEARFLRKQYQAIAAVSACLMLLALLTAWWVARHLAKPLHAVQLATARIASGEFGVRVEASPHVTSRTDELGDLMRNINRMAEGLQRMDQSRRRWLADMSHELRTPLTSLRGEIEAMIDGINPLDQKALVSLREEALQLSSLIDDLHLLAMSDLTALPCHFAEMDAPALLRQIVARFEARAVAAGLALRLDLTGLGGLSTLSVYWDSTRIEQLLGNVLENSLRYTDAPGQIVLSIKTQSSSTDRVVIELNDSAPGVAPESLSHLFEPLYRFDTARSRQHGGSGLGLAICEAIVRSHGGSIEAAPSALGGLRVQIELPKSAEAKA